MDTIEGIIAAAIAEVEQPAFAVTKQILDVHALARMEGRPAIAGVESDEAESHAFVFFSLLDEPYHLWVRVGGAPGKVEFAGITPLTGIELNVTSHERAPQDIAKLLPLAPWQAYIRGDRARQNSAPYPVNRWVYEHEPKRPGFFDSRLESFLSVLRPLAPILRDLPADCSAEVSIVSRQATAWLDGFSFSREALADLASFGVSVDIDVYDSGPPELGV